ncbi:helix-turn-helix domain-containing protein [Streptomyces tsukubensis]|nr:helix-turn-helix domain-containing protein [Streptomyces tsukubensis]
MWELVHGVPDRRLRPGVRAYRGYRLEFDRPRRRLEVPTGAVTLVIGFGAPLWTADLSGGPRRSLHPVARTSVLTGLRSHATLGEHSGSAHGVEVILAPWAAYTCFGVAMDQWAEQLLHPGDLLGVRVDALTDALLALPDWPRRFELLDRTLAQWAGDGPRSSPRVVWAWRELCRTAGSIGIRQLAGGTGWSTRQFEHRFRQQIGLAPKTAARVLRLRRALSLLSRGHSGVDTSLRCGFADQAHLSREVKRMTTLSPSRLVAVRTGVAKALVHDRIEGEITSFPAPPRLHGPPAPPRQHGSVAPAQRPGFPLRRGSPALSPPTG